MSGFAFEDLEDLDEGANDKPSFVGFDALEDLDAAPTPDDGFKPWAAPGDAGSPTQTSATPAEWSRPRYDPFRTGSDTAGAQMREAAADGSYQAAGGALSGLGVNPGQALGAGVERRLATAADRSPTASGLGKFGGELGIQLAAAPAKLGALASGTLGGGLSAIGNTAGGLEDKAKAGVQGAATGLGTAAGLGVLLKGAGRLAEPLQRSSNRQYLRQGGANTADLNKFDREIPGGAQQVAETGRAEGIGSSWFAGPSRYQTDAAKAVERAELGREALSAGAPNIDPQALGAAVERGGAGHLPNTPLGSAGGIRAAVQSEADAARSLGTPQQGVPWGEADKFRKHIGDKTAFSNNPNVNDKARMGMYGGVNDEMGEALSLQNPGAGEQWRQLGRTERDAIGLQGMGARGENRGGDMGLIDTGLAVAGTVAGGPLTGGLSALGGRAVRANANAMAKNVTGGLSSLAQGAGAAAPYAQQAGAAMAGEAVAPKLDQVVLDLLHSPSQGSELGQYRAKFAAAMGQRGQGNVQQLLSELIQTDANFRTQILPLLRGGAR